MNGVIVCFFPIHFVAMKFWRAMTAARPGIDVHPSVIWVGGLTGGHAARPEGCHAGWPHCEGRHMPSQCGPPSAGHRADDDDDDADAG